MVGPGGRAPPGRALSHPVGKRDLPGAGATATSPCCSTARPARSWPWSSTAMPLRCLDFLPNRAIAGAGGWRWWVSDGSESYKAAIVAHLGHATHVLDRFHMVGWFAAGLVAVRRRIQRREPHGQVSPAFDPEVFRSRFLGIASCRSPGRGGNRAPGGALRRPRRAGPGLGNVVGAPRALHRRRRHGRQESLDRFSRLYADNPLPEF